MLAPPRPIHDTALHQYRHPAPYRLPNCLLLICVVSAVLWAGLYFTIEPLIAAVMGM